MKARGMAGVIGRLALVALLVCMVCAGGEETPAPTVWSLSGQGDGVSKLVPVERDGRKFQVLYANGGNTLVVQFAAKTAGGGAVPGDRLTLKSDLLLAEYDNTSRQIERLICTGHVTIRMVSLDSGNPPGEAQLREVTLSAESLVFQHSRAATAGGVPTNQNLLGLLRGVWKLRNDRPDCTGTPTEFTQWVQALPAPSGERVLLSSDRLVLLAPEVTFDPVAGHCKGGPDQVTGSFAPEAAAVKEAPDTDGGRSVAWSSARRTVFSGSELSADFTLDQSGLRPTGVAILSGGVCLYQPPAGPLAGTARLTGDSVIMSWPRGPAHTMGPPRPGDWQGYESVAATGTATDPLVLQDGDMTIRGGAVNYDPGKDVGTLKPAAGQKFAVNEMNLPADAAHPEKGSPGRIRMQAEGFQFHLKTRDFSAQGERILENLPAAPATPGH